MNKIYKNVEVKNFAKNSLKIISCIFSIAFFISFLLLFEKLNKIDNNYDINNDISDIILDSQELMLNIERPSIYTNFESSGQKLADISMKSKDLIILLKKNDLITDKEELELTNSIDKLKTYVMDFNSLLGTSGAEFKSFDTLYTKSRLVNIKQNVLEFIFSTKINLDELEEYINELKQINEENNEELNKTNKKIIALKKQLLNNKPNVEKLLEKIENLEKYIEEVESKNSFLSISINLLNTIKHLHELKNEIKNFSEFNDILIKLKLKILKNINYLNEEKSQIISVALILGALLLFVIIMIFKFSYDLGKILIVLHKAFLTSPIQQILINTKNKDNVYAEYINDNFTFNTFAPTEQSENVRKAEALSFYESIEDIVDASDNAKGFDFGTLVQESHNEVQLYNEDAVTNRKEVRFFSVFRKTLDKDYEHINKVDVTKKILQIKDYKTRLINMQKKLNTDNLTGLLSLQALQDRELREDKTNKNNIFLYLKIDNFNDLRLNYSTLIVDEIIKCFANSLKNALNSEDDDAMLKKINIYHLQLDEFCIVYSTLEDAINAANLIQEHFKSNNQHINVNQEERKNKFNLKINDSFEINDLELNIGISSDRDIRKSNQEILNRLAQAVIASYETVLTKAPFCVYKEGLKIEEQHAEQQKIISLIRYGLDHDRFFVVCQGVHNAMTKEVNYYEVLVRLRDKDNNVISPGVFLDVARKTGLYKDIQEVVINKVFDLIEKYPNAKFSINMANSDINTKDTRTLFENRLAICPRPEALCIEILESEGIDKYEDIASFLNDISKKGCKIAIDDFGSGYSNFYRLLKIKFDYLKIDGSIIESLLRDEKARIVLETLVGFAHRQGYEVVAEFVKNAEILKIVQEYGIEKAQGYELSKPEEPQNIFI